MSSPPPISESSPLLERARWFEHEVQPHEPALRNYLRGRIPSPADVDDVVQDSYVKILQARPASGIQSAKAYLFTVARNTAAKLFRKRKIFSALPVAELPAWRVLDETQDVVALANARLQDALIAEAIAALPPRCREIVLLRVADGLPPVEIAARLRLTESTVRTQLTRGVEKCTAFLRARGVTADS